ncbi:MAG: PilZ domain-containing protein [Marinobacter sp.]|uniref:PilZ domain-containing protein n=1 Tax=Marinobacter sp. TaxID=50741 RepID=UPI0034A00E3F
MDSEAPSERRDYYRIEDWIGLEFKRCPETLASPGSTAENGHLDGLRAELRRLDLDVRNQLASLSEKDRLLATLIKSLNSKVDTLARIMAFEQNPLQPHEWQNATLSEGGISFIESESSLMIDDVIDLRMTLPPELYRPQALAKVISSTPLETGGRRVHAEFTVIQDADRQQIARHVMRWQIRQRQQEGAPYG